MKLFVTAALAVSLSSCAFLHDHSAQVEATAGILAQRAIDEAGEHGQLGVPDIQGLAEGLRSELLSLRTATDVYRIALAWLKPKPGRQQLAHGLAVEFAKASGSGFDKGEAIAKGLDAAAASVNAP